MIKNFVRMVYLTLLVSGWSLAALSLHVVRTPDRIGLIPKERLGVTDTYVDARKWTLSDLPAHADLIRRVLDANKAELFSYLADPNRGDVADQLSNAIQQAPPNRSASVFEPFKGFFHTPSQATPAAASDGPSIAGWDISGLPVDF